MATVIEYCPIHEERPERPKNQNPLYITINIPKICLSCQAKNSTLIAEIRVAEKVRVCAPGESGRDKKAQKECLFNRKKRPKANRSKSQPP